MRSSIKKYLTHSEVVIFHTQKHGSLFFVPLFWALIGLLFSVMTPSLKKLALFPFLMALIFGMVASFQYFFSGLTITDRRVLVHIGLMRTVLIQIPLERIKSVEIRQNIWGRLFHYGMVYIYDIHDQCLSFDHIKAPEEFRYHLQKLIDLDQ